MPGFPQTLSDLLREAALYFLIGFATLSTGSVRAADVPACSAAQANGPQADAQETDRHRQFDVPVVDYPPVDTPDFNLYSEFTLRIDEAGRVVCFVDAAPGDWHRLEPEQRALVRRSHAWRYRPFLRDGRPVAVIASQRFDEQILPQRHVRAPQVPLDQVSITLVQGQGFFGGPAYAVHIRGDGWVGFHALAGTDVAGTFAYRVPREEVASVVAMIRRGDLWSAEDHYQADTTDQATRWLTVRFGNQTKVITDYAGRALGMPMVVSRVQEEVARVAHAEQWITLSDAALDRLQRDGFDFKSPAATRMLHRAVRNRWATDDRAMLRLLMLGTPIDLPDREDSLMVDALRLRRTQLIGPLIARGALNTNGRPDQRKIDTAFRAAVVGGRLEPLRSVWAVAGSQSHPALTMRDEPEYRNPTAKNDVPVALLLDRDYNDADWQGLEIARWLAALGNDLHATGADGRTLLMAAAEDDDDRFVRYLLSQGADPTARGRHEHSLLDSAQAEDVALALLEAGSELPREFKGYRFEAERKGWGRVVAWLDAHRSAPIMPLTEREREDAARLRRSQERVRNSPCWQRWIAEQARAIAMAKEKGARRVEDVPMYCLCGGRASWNSAAETKSSPSDRPTVSARSCSVH